MRILPFVFLLLMGMTWRCVRSTCVFETDFGLSINCGLKKSGIFRVRNLGGLKGYVGVGLQLADELGFKESLSTLEQNSKRRSVNGFSAPGSFDPLVMPQNNNRGAMAPNSNNQDRSLYAKMNGRALGSNQPATVPPFRPLMSAANNLVRNVRLSVQQQQQQQQQQQEPQPLLKPLPVPAFAALPESIAKVAVETPKPPVAAQKRPLPMPVAAIMPVAVGRIPAQQLMQPISPAALMTLSQPIVSSPPFAVQQQPKIVPLPSLPPQQQLPSPVYYQNVMQQAANRRFNAFAPSPQNSTEVRPIIVLPVVDNRKKNPDSLPLSNEVDPSSMMSLFHAAAANNVSVEQLAIALRLQQQKNLSPFYSTPGAMTVPTSTPETTTTTTTTPPPPPSTTAYFPEEPPVPKKISIRPYKSKYSSGHKVMNAPKEYYPVSYDKNFDDNFVSKVDLPDTSFSCGDQKHFPGLYGDEDLGCMVFHVCAFTDDGLTQKSFLCPESTLFDQTILKCNWWFYVDCKSSRKLYDSNIPVSKSYQLMKALTFFSSYAGGPTVDASVAAATAAVSQESSADTVASSPPPTNAATPSTTTEVLDNVSFRR